MLFRRMLLAGLELARAFHSQRNGGKENKDRKIVRKDLKRLAGGARLEEEEAISVNHVYC